MSAGSAASSQQTSSYTGYAGSADNKLTNLQYGLYYLCGQALRSRPRNRWLVLPLGRLVSHKLAAR